MSDPLGAPSPKSDDDLYVLLNSSRYATVEELRQSFRKLSQLYHPDKHVEESAKAVANERFTRIKEAYELLSDDKLRRIYDEFGLLATREAASPTMELTTYDDLAARFRHEANVGAANGTTNTPRDAYFNVVNSCDAMIDGTGLVVALEDGFRRGDPLFSVLQVAITSQATAYVAQNLTVTAQYSTMSSSGAGDLGVATRYQMDPHMHAEVEVTAPLDEPSSAQVTTKVVRSLNERMQMHAWNTYDIAQGVSTASIAVVRSLSQRYNANISWSAGAAPKAQFQWHREAYNEYISGESEKKSYDDDDDDDSEIEEVDGTAQVAVNASKWRKYMPSMRELEKYVRCFIDPMGFTCACALGTPSFYIAFTRPIGSQAPLFRSCTPTGPGGTSIKTSLKVYPAGFEVEAGAKRNFVMSDSTVGMSVACGTNGVMLNVKITRGGHRLTLPIILVTETDPRTATVAAITSSLMVAAVNSLLIQPVLRYQKAVEKAEIREQRSESLAKAKRDAEAAHELLARQVATSRENEENVVIDGRQKAGLIVERAIYGVKEVVCGVKFGGPSFVGRELETEVIEVGDCVQALIENSAVQIVSNTKSTLMGFWDPSALGEKEDLALRIWYKFRDELHDCLVDDMEPLELPLSSHKVSSWS